MVAIGGIGGGIDHREFGGIAIDHENMAAGRIEGDAVGIRLGLDAFAGLQGLEIEGNRHSGLAIDRIAFAGGGRDADAVGAAGHALDIADDGPVMPVQNRQPVAMRDIEAMGVAVEHQIVPAVRRPQRHGFGKMVGRHCRLRQRGLDQKRRRPRANIRAP